MGVVLAQAAGPVPGGGTQLVQRRPAPHPPEDDAVHDPPTSAAPEANLMAARVMMAAAPSRCCRVVDVGAFSGWTGRGELN
jgi:hypothetical protein